MCSYYKTEGDNVNITINELLALKTDNIIDIRSSNQYNLGHLPNAKNIPSMKLLASPEKYLNKDETYYIYCQTGMTSDKICQILRKKNYKLVNVVGGYQSWNLRR